MWTPLRWSRSDPNARAPWAGWHTIWKKKAFRQRRSALIRKHAEEIKPPRALAVPFELGRPLGAPNEPEFQRRVLRECLELLNAESGPVLADFPDTAPGRRAEAKKAGRVRSTSRHQWTISAIRT